MTGYVAVFSDASGVVDRRPVVEFRDGQPIVCDRYGDLVTVQEVAATRDLVAEVVAAQPWTAAAREGVGCVFQPAAHNGHLMAFSPTKVVRGVPTSHGPAKAVHCSRVVDLDTGQVLTDVLVFGELLTAAVGAALVSAHIAPPRAGIALGRLDQDRDASGLVEIWLLRQPQFVSPATAVHRP